MNHVAPSKLLNESGLSGAKQQIGAGVADKQPCNVRHTSIHPWIWRLQDSLEKLLQCRTCGTRWHHKCRSSCCHVTWQQRHRGDPKGRAFGATWHIAAVKIVAGSSKRVAGRSRQNKNKKKPSRRIVALLSSTVELFVWTKFVRKNKDWHRQRRCKTPRKTKQRAWCCCLTKKKKGVCTATFVTTVGIDRKLIPSKRQSLF